MKKFRILFILLTGFLYSSTSFANWSLNIGYQNPGVSEFGLNFMYEWSNFAFEAGIGQISSKINLKDDDKDNDNVSLGLGGDIDIKMFFNKSTIRPYIQLGTLIGTSGSVGDDTGLSIGTGSTFFGGGLFFGKTSFYGYLSYNISHSSFIQAGLGFDI